MAAPCRIRPAQSADRDRLAAIERAVFPDPWPPEAFAHPGTGEQCLVAETDGEVVGYIVSRAAADQGEILNLAVQHRWRRAGVGSRLLEAALTGLAAGGIRQVFLEVRESNRGARTFYRRRGFREAGRRRGYYRTPTEDAVLLVRALAGADGHA